MAGHRPAHIALAILLLSTIVGVAIPPRAGAEQASQPGEPAAAQIDTGRNHSCAILPGGGVRCWGSGAVGELGYPGTDLIGDNEAPGSAGPVDLGAGRSARAISAGGFHTCALLDDASVRCWGYGGDGRLGYGNTATIGDDETPGSVGPVALGRPAIAISAGYGHTCAVLDNGSVRCWGYAQNGALGYGNTNPVGDTETPASVSPVSLGTGRTATAISAGQDFTCALLDNATVRCWGFGDDGRLGYGNTAFVGDNETPGSVGPVDLGRSAKAITAGTLHACALLDNNSVRCWGRGHEGALGYGKGNDIGDDETPASAVPVNLGGGHTAKAISAGRPTCALLDDNSVRCWGINRDGQLGYGHTLAIGDDETPGSVGPVQLGAGRTARALAVSERHTCARLDNAGVRCWGLGTLGRLGYCNELTIGDDETPGVLGPVPLESLSCVPGRAAAAPRPSGGVSYPLAGGPDPSAAEAARRRELRGCLAKGRRHRRLEMRKARRLSGARRTRARRHARQHGRRLRRRCLSRHGRTPGTVTGLRAQALSKTQIQLTFNAPGSDGQRPPPAHSYLVKQSRRPIRSRRGFRRGVSLCKGSCRFENVTGVGIRITLEVTNLRPRTTYYYAVAARDNVSRRVGPRSRTVRARTR